MILFSLSIENEKIKCTCLLKSWNSEVLSDMKDLKYMAAYINPVITALGLWLGGAYTYMNVVFVFVLIPIIDQLSSQSEENISVEERTEFLKRKIFDWLLYLNLPILYGILILFIIQLNTLEMSAFELVGNILSVGIVIGTCGINVGHELGHRASKIENLIAQLLLTPAMYVHFFVEHNRGHHKHVATDLDPASARKGEGLYFFWLKSTFMGYLSAWSIEASRLGKLKKNWFSSENMMIRLTILQITYVVALFLLTGFPNVLYLLCAGIVGILLLETINYLEHYGLRRKQLENGRFEKVLPKHSWNSNHSFGRIVLYELTRHSDHHYIASKKYQILDHHDESPQLPAGYPAMILAALVPPLWFYLMDKRIPGQSFI